MQEGDVQTKLNLPVINPVLEQTGNYPNSGEKVVEETGEDSCADVQEMDRGEDVRPTGSELRDVGQSKNWKKRARSIPRLIDHQGMEVDGCQPSSWGSNVKEAEGSGMSTPKRMKRVQGEVEVPALPVAVEQPWHPP